MDRPKPGKVEDLTTLAHLDEDVLLQELKVRYSENNVYTYVGDILIAVNPFRSLEIYGRDESDLYFLSKKSANPPHIFAVADSAYQAMLGHGGRIPTNQCILISGESGAGKTESTKLIIKQLVELCRGNTQLEQQILQVNPLLEAFGNAQTLMNDNSSRFGKYIQLIFQGPHVIGAKISEYLLEKSRVVLQNEEEENFHIFYYIFAGLSKEYQQQCHLEHAEKYRYLTNGASCLRRDAPLLKQRYEELVNAMDLVGFTDEEEQNLFMAIASLLHLGQVTFEADDNEAAFVDDENGPIKLAAKLLEISAEELGATLTSMVTITRGEHFKRNYTTQQADDARDAVSKAIYSRLFGWIVNKINQLLAPRAVRPEAGDRREIGILDIFGFEHFQKNSFEQACINLANEQLQYFFNHYVFRLEQEEYIREGIDWKEIKFVDNQPLLDLFLAKPIGLLSLLDEETNFPKGSDQSFVDKLNTHFSGKPAFIKSPHSNSLNFGINHYAGKVQYDAYEWLDKNRDTLPPGLTEILQSSKNDLIKHIFRGQVTRTGSLAFQGRKSTSRRSRKSRPKTEMMQYGDAAKKRKMTMGTQFKNSLQILMERMTSATPVFVRCLKPNHKKVPGLFDNSYIKQQLLYTGMLETTKIRREGFAVRPTFAEFVEKFKIILCKSSLTGTRENCVKILQATKIQGCQVGKTRVFLKYWHLEQLSDILEQMGRSALQIQRVARGFMGRQKYKRHLEAARRQALQVQSLLTSIQNLCIDLGNQQQMALNNDQNIPKGFFNKGGPPSGQPPPPPPDFPSSSMTPSGSVKSYLEPVKKRVDFGTQMDPLAETSDSDISDDEFQPVQISKPGNAMASVRWFKETQTEQVYDPSRENLIAEWFHGVISRRDSERLLKSQPVGCFLIRVSESRFGYSLSFRAEDRCRHYMIDQLPNKKYIIIGESKVHRTLKDLVQYHQKIKISNWNGLLSKSCGQEKGRCDYEELITDSYYFTLEENASQQQILYTVPTRGIIRRENVNRDRSSKFSNRSSRPLPPTPSTSGAPPPVPNRSSVVSQGQQPPLPARNYSTAASVSHQVAHQSTDRHSRPLPKTPAQAYQRLLNNQEAQHDQRRGMPDKK